MLLQVKEGDQVLGCKSPCPSCKVNDHVIVHGLNMASGVKAVRFAYGDGRAIMAISIHYVCCNPDCPLVKGRRRDDAPNDMMLLRKSIEQGGVLGTAKRGADLKVPSHRSIA